LKFVVISHSLLADPTGGNAYFLRGVITELESRGHDAEALELPGTSRVAIATLDLDATLGEADIVLVDGCDDPSLVARIGAHGAAHGGYRLYFRDIGRARTAPEAIDRLDLAGYDGVLANGEAVRQAYLERGWSARAWTWHEAADTRVFRPRPETGPQANLVWIGDWEGGERSGMLRSFLLRPARTARLHGHVYGAGYPLSARLRIRLSGLHFRDSSADREVPELFARHRLTVHLPRPAEAEALPGVPTSYPFQALACGIPLISAPWEDGEGLFRPEEDYLLARDCAEMREAMQAIVEFPEFAAQLRESGLETIRARHTCAHRVDELLAVDAEVCGGSATLVRGRSQ
jgi:spore maturation protein CgeB